MSLRFPFHGFSLINDHVKWRRFVGLGLPHCVWVLSASSFPHVMAVVRVIYGCQEVPASSLRPPKTRPTQRGGGSGDGGVSQPQNALMYLLGNKRIAEVDGPLSSRPEPRTNLFHLLFLLAEEEGGCSSSFSSGILAPITDSLRDIWLRPPHCPSLCSFPSLSPQPCSLPCPLLLPPWASELGSLPFGFPLFLPSFLSCSANSSLVPD